ncbi:MAG: SMI1/KNR4 family protein [Methanobrevibacter sp.]|nr:SMI1/KNR4 family protein [Methanobrevibacter sp.]
MNSELKKIVAEKERELGIKLPRDYIEYLGSDSEFVSRNGAVWFPISELMSAEEYDIPNFEIVEDWNEHIDDIISHWELDIKRNLNLSKWIPLFAENDSYLIYDARENGLGFFVIWSDETEIGMRFDTFSEFMEDNKRRKLDSGLDEDDFDSDDYSIERD